MTDAISNLKSQISNQPAAVPVAVARRFDVRNSADGKEAEIYLYDVIGDDGCGGGISAKAFVDEVQAKCAGASRLVLNINSPGGSCFDADAIYNFLMRHPSHKVVNIDGFAASAAATVAMAGDKHNIAANAMMMIHGAWGVSVGKPADMRRYADLLDKLDASIAATYCQRTGNTPDQVKSWMDAETWFDAEECVKSRFATNLVESKKAAALAGITPQMLSMLHITDIAKAASLVVSAAPATPTSGKAAKDAAEGDTQMTDKQTTGAGAGGQVAAPVSAADLKAEGKRFMDGFGEASGAKYFAQGLTFEAAQNAHIADLTAQGTAKDAEIADLKKKLSAANAAIGVDPLGAGHDEADSAGGATDAEKKYKAFLKVCKGDEQRAKRMFNSWQEHRASQAKRVTGATDKKADEKK